jgi:SOS-response transcriptional repressor LexA
MAWSSRRECPSDRGWEEVSALRSILSKLPTSPSLSLWSVAEACRARSHHRTVFPTAREVRMASSKYLFLTKKSCGSLFIRYNRRMAITRRQKEVIDFLSSFTQKNGYSPSYEEIARPGPHLARHRAQARHQPAEQGPAAARAQPQPLDRRAASALQQEGLRPPAAAGPHRRRQAVEAIETAESISLADIIGNREVFALEVRGDSMRDEHIVSGDYVLVERTAPRAKARSSSPWSTAPTPPSSASTARAA